MPYLGTMHRNFIEPHTLKRLKVVLRRREAEYCGQCEFLTGTVEGWCCRAFRDRHERMRLIGDIDRMPVRLPDCRNLEASF